MSEPRGNPTCPLCGAPERLWLVKGGREVHRCPACRFVFVPEGVKTASPGVTIYQAEDNVFLQDGNENYYLDPTHLASFAQKFEWVQRYVPAGARLLDVGSNFGHFLKTAQGHYDARGFDLSPQAVRWSLEHFGVRNFTGSIYAPPAEVQGVYDVLTSWDVVEHIPSAGGALRQLHGLLKPGGYLFLSTPDLGSAVARLLGRHWHYLDPEQHIALYTRANLKGVLEQEGFEVVEVRSFGHHYRLRYVFNRLRQLHPGGPLAWCVRAGRWLFTWALDREIYVRLGDVMGIAARRRP